ncbi:DUF3567 domain-containing protein [Caldimonas thermodepolymerans]|jgi:Glycyl-tRNA synthetase, beta subunit|uniref:DUF3567 domain-containing protein n=1 Tax=Caldimonas thermodepolymerans TaxID=215580 RepID=A0A2S5T7T1_9BURK|nr:DUF3567 domain-containing protein [Caldimonas thermodepolymerans]PPE71016.1 DUF3567 domain-containing protein [Caldimonas thermodepolymerans]QPC31316.1 DUF3567 domain-containing protein [Caldimonas thermodepolymerans]RDH99719.1 uncharacterized protein DUF3567 [Caldimonas thermodepolymerans]TCP07555.1 uncharacterized protein DUF3567 [Caldimonas thermodepolymerans]UZG44060.1 DUF3567 domain-containing protein [Caldimonas thermodepolymerans]
MQMLYNSENFAVVEFQVPAAPPQAGEEGPALTRGGYEIVDKFKRKEIYLEGALAESFKQGVEALIEGSPTVEDIDAYIERFTSLMQQPVVLH